MGPLSSRVILRFGALVAVVVAPLAIIGNAADEGSALRNLCFLGQLAVFVGGGAVAARRSPTQPVTHAALAVLAGWAMVQVVALVVRVLSGDDIGWAALPFLAVFVATTGMVGGLLASWRGSWRRRPDRAH